MSVNKLELQGLVWNRDKPRFDANVFVMIFDFVMLQDSGDGQLDFLISNSTSHAHPTPKTKRSHLQEERREKKRLKKGRLKRNRKKTTR